MYARLFGRSIVSDNSGYMETGAELYAVHSRWGSHLCELNCQGHKWTGSERNGIVARHLLSGINDYLLPNRPIRIHLSSTIATLRHEEQHNDTGLCSCMLGWVYVRNWLTTLQREARLWSEWVCGQIGKPKWSHLPTWRSWILTFGHLVKSDLNLKGTVRNILKMISEIYKYEEGRG